jgi:hypothetical protein
MLLPHSGSNTSYIGLCRVKYKMLIEEGLNGLKSSCNKMKGYPDKGPHGQFVWEKDINRAEESYTII